MHPNIHIGQRAPLICPLPSSSCIDLSQQNAPPTGAFSKGADHHPISVCLIYVVQVSLLKHYCICQPPKVITGGSKPDITPAGVLPMLN